MPRFIMVFTAFVVVILPLEKAVKWGREIAVSVPSSKGGCGDVYHMRREQRRAVVHKAASQNYVTKKPKIIKLLHEHF